MKNVWNKRDPVLQIVSLNDDVGLIITQIPLVHAGEDYPNTYECGLQFFTAPEGKLISPKEIPCAKLAEELSELLDDDEMSNGTIHASLTFSGPTI